MTEPTRNRVEGLRGVRYGEVLLARFDGVGFSAEVWNTMGFNDCPPDEFAALDPAAIAAERDALLAIMNGPRHWVLDAIESTMRATAPTTRFGTLDMFLAASVDLGPTPPSATPYTERGVSRDTVFEWAAGTPLHELTAPDGNRYVMQALALYVDPDQTLDTLAALGPRLALPDGWTFSTRTADRPLRLLSAEDGVATVLQDELANTYQRIDRTD